MKKKWSYEHLHKMNSQLPCTYCRRRNRYKGERLCRVCATANGFHGHPAAKAIPLRELGKEQAIAAQLVAANAGHPSLLHFKQWLTDWIAAAHRSPDGVPGGKIIASKFPLDFSNELDVLVRAVMLYLRFHVFHDFRLPDVGALWYAIGHRCILRYFPMSQKEINRLGRRIHRDVALYCQQSLRALLEGFLVAYKGYKKLNDEQERLLEEQPLAF